MREMKDSGIEWIGIIPKDWGVHPVYNYFGERKRKNSLGKENNLLSLSYGYVIRKNINTVGGLLPESFNTYNIIEKNDIVIRPTDLQNDKRSLRTGLVKEHGIITSAYITLKPKDSRNDSRYFHYLLHTYDVMKVFYNMGNGVRQGLNYSEFSNLMIFSPSYAEQKEIADFLDIKCNEIDALTSDIQTQIETLEQYKKSVITEAVTKGLNPDVEMKDSGIEWIGNMPSNWNIAKTKYLSKISIGLVTTMTSNYVENPDDGVPLIRNGDIRLNRIEPNGMVYISNSFAEKNTNRKLQLDDIVTVHTGYIGTSALINDDYNGSVGFATIQSRPNKQVINERFLCWFYNSHVFIEQCMAHNTGDGRQNLNLYDFVDFWVIYPDLEEQRKIADYLDKKCKEIDLIIITLEKQKDILSQYKKSVIFEYVTGKKEVL